jgi:[acyl-carrier-protein] S-malonyltransferase
MIEKIMEKKLKSKKIAMIAPGYGNQSVGMGKDFYDNFRLFQENFEHASQCLGYNVTRLCFAASSSDLLNPVHSYIAQFVHTHTIAQFLREKYAIKPDLVTGYGIGSIGSLSVLETINFVDGIYVAKKYLEILTNSTQLADYASYRFVGALLDDINIALADDKFQNLQLISSDSYKSHIISGSIADLNDFIPAIKSRRRSTRYLNLGLGHGLGLEILSSVNKIFKPYFNKVDFMPSMVPLLSSVDGKKIILKNRQVIENELLRSLSSPLSWSKVVHKLAVYDYIIILGPAKLIRQGLEETLDINKLYFCDSIADVEKLATNLAVTTFSPDFNNYYTSTVHK